MSKFAAQQDKVSEQLWHLEDVALPADMRDELEQGGHVSWPSKRADGATDFLRYEHKRLLVAPLASLIIQFDEEVATGITFQRYDSKIVLVSRIVGQMSAGEMLWPYLRTYFIPRERPDQTDYKILAEELQTGIDFYEQERRLGYNFDD